jgi:two-component system OmpR family sensor kinase
VSLRARLLLAVGAVALIALIAADVATYSAFRSFLFNQVDVSLETAHPSLEQALDSGQTLDVGTVARLAPGMFVEVRGPAGENLGEVPAFERGGQQVAPALPGHFDLPQITEPGPGEPAIYLTVGSATPGGPQFRVRASALLGGNQLILAAPLSDTAGSLHRLLLIEVAVTGGALAAAAVLGWWVVRVGLRPLAEVERTADAIAEGDLTRRVPEAQPSTEVGRLARALNAMLERIQDAFRQRDRTEAELRRSEERLRRFVADASHELRTPLAAVSAYAELFERGAHTQPEDLARVMAGVRSETARMGLLVEDLLLLARLDEGRPLERRPVELVRVAAEAVNAARTVDASWPAQVVASQPVDVIGDASRLRQVIDNLLANVRAHTPPGTRTTVRVAREGSEAVVEVADNGPGLNAEQAEKAFERFYRGEVSRSRQYGGAGLGLSIVAAIVGAHRGTVGASDTDGGGATFTVRLPADQNGTAPATEKEPSGITTGRQG